MSGPPGPFQVFTTCPQSSKYAAPDYRRRVDEVARWSEEFGAEGILVYADNGIADPWTVAQQILATTERLAPLVAVQPAYVHPYTVAKKIATVGHLYHRRLYLNMIAGGFRNDLISLGDTTPHDQRYERLCEYTRIVLDLLDGQRVTRQGEWYHLTNVSLAPSLDPTLLPGVLLSGSSQAGREAAALLGAVAVEYPAPPGEPAAKQAVGSSGIRVGILARPSAAEAWEMAHARFPPNRKGQMLHQLSMKASDSQWHATLSELGRQSAQEANPYWLGPFENYDTFCPYLVGDYSQVAAELARYRAGGHEVLILDIPAEADDLTHTARALELVGVDVSG